MKRRNIFLTASLFVASIGAKADGFNAASCIRFCNEPLPTYNHRVVQNYEEALLNSGVATLRQMKPRIDKFFNVVEPILKKYHIPSDFKYLGIVESGISANALSPKGAYGYWQFMPETARQFGLVVDENTDEREHLVKSTHAACRYFLTLYKEFGSWSLVAAAYNAGPNKVKNHMVGRRKSDYYDLRLGNENEQYVYKIIATKELLTRPAVYRNVMIGKTTLSKFFSKYGIAMGLITPPNIRIKKNFLRIELTDFYQGNLDEALVGGFASLIPLPFKRGVLMNFLASATKADANFAHKDDARRRLVLWRSTLRIPQSRRQSLKSLLAAAKMYSSSSKRLFKVASV